MSASLNAWLTDPPADPEDDLAKEHANLLNDPVLELNDELAPSQESFNDAMNLHQKLSYLVADIGAVGGISRQHAALACESLPAMAEARPLAYYTTSPSQTHLKASLEEMSHGMMAAIAAASAALLAVIYKLYKWIAKKFGAKDDSPGGVVAAVDQAIKTNQEQADTLKDMKPEVVDANKELKASADEVSKVLAEKEAKKSGEKRTEEEIKKSIDEYKKSIKSSKDALVAHFLKDSESNDLVKKVYSSALFHDIIGHGSSGFTTKIYSVSRSLATLVIPAYRVRVELIQKMIEDDIFANNSLPVSDELHDQYIKIRKQPKWTEDGRAGGELTLRDIRSNLQQEFDRLTAEKIETDGLDPSQVMAALFKMSEPRGLKDTMLHSYRDALELIGSLKTLLEKVEKKAGSAGSDNSHDGMKNRALAEDVREVMFAIREDLSEMTAIATMIQSFLSAFDNYTKVVVGAYSSTILKIETQLRGTSVIESMPALKRAAEFLRKENAGRKRLFPNLFG